MSINSATPSAPAPWAVATVLGYLRDEVNCRAETAKRLRHLGDIERQQQIIDTIHAIEDLAIAHFAVH
jgi:hypothetical protein